MSAARRTHRRKAWMAAQLVVAMLGVVLLTIPSRTACDMGFVDAMSGPHGGACHAQVIMPLTMSWRLPANDASAIVPNGPLAIALAVLAFVALRFLTPAALPASITNRLRFMRWVWATSMPYKGARLRLPYLSPLRDA